MKIKTVRIENLRSIKDETVHFDDYTCFVGANGAGKSTILFALNVFFRDASGSTTDVAVLSAEDFHGKNTKEPIRITVTFGLPAVLSGIQRRKAETKGEEKGTRFGWMSWVGFVGGTIDAGARAKVPFQTAHGNYASL